MKKTSKTKKRAKKSVSLPVPSSEEDYRVDGAARTLKDAVGMPPALKQKAKGRLRKERDIIEKALGE